jgi:hypothetical protein
MQALTAFRSNLYTFDHLVFRRLARTFPTVSIDTPLHWRGVWAYHLLHPLDDQQVGCGIAPMTAILRQLGSL